MIPSSELSAYLADAPLSFTAEVTSGALPLVFPGNVLQRPNDSPMPPLTFLSMGVFEFACVLSALQLACVLALAWFVRAHRRHPAVFASSPFFLGVILLGSVFATAAGVLTPIDGQIAGGGGVDAACLLAPIFLCVAFALVAGGLTAKSYRIWRIYQCTRLQM